MDTKENYITFKRKGFVNKQEMIEKAWGVKSLFFNIITANLAITAKSP